ncbi:MAG: Protein translocase subunit SecF [candidate division Zixibacteria bacterium RBG-1]|nr:MAG: Protein translocase subunit SecF [candidate division Zixibacteria bacterium RBG-1]
MLELIKKTSIDFIGKRYYAFGLSGILVLLGIIAFVTVVLGKAKLGIDFSGGTMIQGNFAQPISISDLRAAMSRNGYTDAEIQELQREIPNSFLIRVKATSGTGGQVANQLILVLEKEFPNNKFKTDSVDEVGPAVGKSLQSKARFAVLISLIGILLYIWVRFDFRFGVAATVATFHDVLAVLGIFFILQKEITLLVITALLTLAGYSLTDTVVVFDRIRENLKLFRKRGDFPSLINASINEVLSRTIITSTTVFLVVTVLFFLGGEVVHDFALALMLGVIIGTYSSIFVASPLMVEWERKVPKRFK